MTKNTLIFFAAVLFLCFGCVGSYNSYLKPTAGCQPLSAFDTIIIAPFNGDAALVEEEKYEHLPREVARAASEQLKINIEEDHLFKKVLQSSNCADHAVKIDGSIYSLIHSRRTFHLGVRGQVVNCQTGESLYRFDNDDEQDSDIVILPRQIAEKISEGIRAKLKCEK
ncbi:MAG TPA: hypothetical protein VF903_07335 [Nitrospirota bacterium]